MSKNAKVQLGLTKDVKVRQGISKDAQVRLRMCTGTLKYSLASPYGHLSNTDTSGFNTDSSLGPGKCPYILCKNILYNTDNGNEISAPERKFIKT